MKNVARVKAYEWTKKSSVRVSAVDASNEKMTGTIVLWTGDYYKPRIFFQFTPFESDSWRTEETDLA